MVSKVKVKGNQLVFQAQADDAEQKLLAARVVYFYVIADHTALTTGTGKMYFTVPPTLNGMNLIDADAMVHSVSTSGLPTIKILNETDGNFMLSTPITIDVAEYSSYTATTPPVIDTTKDDVVTGDLLRIDVDGAGTETEGLHVVLTFQLP